MRGFLRLSSATLVDLFGGIATTLIILRIADPERLGIYSLLLSLGLLVSGLSILGLDVVMRYYISKGVSPESFIGTALVPLSLASLGLFLVSPISGFLSILSGLYTLQISYALAKRDYKTYFRVVLSRRLLQPIIVPIAFYFYGPKIAVIALALTFLPSVGILRRARIEIPRVALRDSLRSALTRVSTAISIYFDKVFVKLLYGYFTLGVFYFVRQIGMLASFPAMIIDRYALQEISSGREIKKEFYLSLLATLLLALSLRLFRGLIALIFPNFSPYVSLLRAAGVFIILRTINAYLKSLVLARGFFFAGFLAQVTAFLSIIITIYLSRGSLIIIALSPAIGQAFYPIGLVIGEKINRNRRR